MACALACRKASAVAWVVAWVAAWVVAWAQVSAGACHDHRVLQEADLGVGLCDLGAHLRGRWEA